MPCSSERRSVSGQAKDDEEELLADEGAVVIEWVVDLTLSAGHLP